MATFVLVHGGFHGGWCWSGVAHLQRESGHNIFTPTLTGLGERSHLARPEVDLTTHITDVVNVLHFEELSDVVLVGHSYAGMVIAGVAAAAGDQLSSLVFLDAVHPFDGEALVDVYPTARAFFREPAEAFGDGWLIPVPDLTFGLEDEDLLSVKRRLTPQPLATLEQPVRTASEWEIPHWAINCTEGVESFIADRHGAIRDAGRYFELPGPHDVMISNPRSVVDVLEHIVKHS